MSINMTANKIYCTVATLLQVYIKIHRYNHLSTNMNNTQSTFYKHDIFKNVQNGKFPNKEKRIMLALTCKTLVSTYSKQIYVASSLQ